MSGWDGLQGAALSSSVRTTWPLLHTAHTVSNQTIAHGLATESCTATTTNRTTNGRASLHFSMYLYHEAYGLYLVVFGDAQLGGVLVNLSINTQYAV